MSLQSFPTFLENHKLAVMLRLPVGVLSPHNAALLFTFSRAVLRAVPQLTERLVEASNQCTHLILFTFITAKLRENRGDPK